MNQLNPEISLKLETFFEEVKINMHQIADRSVSNANHHYKSDPLENLSEKFDTFQRLIKSLTSDLEALGNEALQNFDKSINNLSNADRMQASKELRRKLLEEVQILSRNVTKQLFDK